MAAKASQTNNKNTTNISSTGAAVEGIVDQISQYTCIYIVMCLLSLGL